MWRQSTAPAMLKNVPVQLTLAAGEKGDGSLVALPRTLPRKSNALKPQTTEWPGEAVRARIELLRLGGYFCVKRGESELVENLRASGCPV